ncbi:threonine-phosphate decarboxylase CobD [Paracoccaceae bacterium GXU_MW_L88]
MSGRDHGRDHGGDLDRARALFGGADWLDLSTGINPVPYPLPALPSEAWTRLPHAADLAALEDTARAAYQTDAAITPLAGAQAAIQLVPRLMPPGRALVLGPTYNEHAAALRAQGWTVEEVDSLDAFCAGADLAVVVNPNNPTGAAYPSEKLREIRQHLGLLIVDESFADPLPNLSLAPHLSESDNMIVLRSFGKFYGLAGLRLGFALSGEGMATRLRALAGPWAVSGPAIAIGRAALADRAWQQATTARLQTDTARLDGLAAKAGWTLTGGTPLFRTYATPNADDAQKKLAKAQIWSRIFPYSKTWIRLGLPGSETSWARLAVALRG